MERVIKNILTFIVFSAIVLIVWASNANISKIPFRKSFEEMLLPPDTIVKNPNKLPFPIKDKGENPTDQNNKSSMDFQQPKNFETEVTYDPVRKQYVLKRKIGKTYFGNPEFMTLEEYSEYDSKSNSNNYWNEKRRSEASNKSGGLIPKIHVGGKVFETIFGSNSIDIRPSGSAELIFAYNIARREDPLVSIRQQRVPSFDFDQKIQMNVTAKVGDKIELGANYNTESSFEFDNKMKLKYEGKEDEIIKLIEAGNVSLPLTGTLISGSQSLFGIKTKLQFGKVTVTSVVSRQNSKSSTINVSGGAQINTFEIKADQYEENKHFFVDQYFKNNYNKAFDKLPLISSNIVITKVEVWKTTVGPATGENRNIIAMTDLGNDNNNNKYPSNQIGDVYYNLINNNLRDIYSADIGLNRLNYVATTDYEIVESATKLQPTEYTFNSKLGFISLNSALNADQVLAVAFQYRRIDDTTTYQVGEFSTDGIVAPKALFVKLLKSTATNTRGKLWGLMMKNVYSLGAYQVNKDDFRLNILFENDANGAPINYIPNGKVDKIPLLKVLNLDKINTLGDSVSDGVFDFVDNAAKEGGTIQSTTGRIFFPVLEPFGKDLRIKITGGDPSLDPIANKYCYDSLYTMTKSGALQFPEKNKFMLEGRYKASSGSDISLNAMNIPQGSVKVTSGGIPLNENIDYTVDYQLGRVKIINEGILNSGAPIQINLESNTMFSIQTKTLLGTHVEYKINNDFNVGATVLNLSEKPMTKKINYGDESISNTIWGMNMNYSMQAPIITKILDKLPFYSTKEMSKITVEGEFAHFIPGHSKAIGNAGISYIDDFEGSKSSIELKNISTWSFASTPQHQPHLFNEASRINDLSFNYNRAKIAWYSVDRVFFESKSNTPGHIKNDANARSDHFVRQIEEIEIFPNKESQNNIVTPLNVMNIAFYPKERGIYNYDTSNVAIDGTFLNPNTRWGGIMRKIENPDFEAANIEYIEFWMMDPFIKNPEHNGGDFYFNLGDVSEDILRDGRKSFENGLPIDGTIINVDTTIWGRVPRIQALTNSFAVGNGRTFQDVGLDGLSSNDELSFFEKNYLSKMRVYYNGTPALQKALADPSSDDYHYFLGDDYDDQELSIENRYKKYNNLEGNSPETSGNPTAASPYPNVEDVNKDNTLSKNERYFQYHISLRPQDMIVGSNYITDVYESSVRLANNNVANVRWYQFKIPVNDQKKEVYGNIQDFKSIRFIRMFMKNFSDPVICRFATLELVRGNWRKYSQKLLEPGSYMPEDNNTLFDVSTVNIEENSNRKPIPYVLPPKIERETNLNSTTLQQLNEQSLSLKVVDLTDGDSRAIYKTSGLDVRNYKRLKMFVHAESVVNSNPLNTGDLTVFIRLGKDFSNNYYEYEIPLIPTQFNTSSPDDIWNEQNEIDIEFDNLVKLKLERNALMRELNSNVSLTTIYPLNPNSRIKIIGNPSLDDIKVIMIGVRNPKNKNTDADFGLPKSGEIWVNELRLSDFDENGGWATTGRVSMNLADLGSLKFAGSFASSGFGSLEQKIGERKKDNSTQYGIETNIELGKFLPKKSGITIPMHFDYSEEIHNPKYNPLNPDVLLKEELKTFKTQAQKDSVKKVVQDFTFRKSINFMNVRKNRTGTAKPRLYDIENFDATYIYTEVFNRNIDVEYDSRRAYKAALGYNFANNPKNFTPFSKIKLFNYKAFKLIKDFNFYLLPKAVSVRTNVDRTYAENLMRNKSIGNFKLEPTYVKTFNWNRQYDVKFDLTQSIKLDYNANAIARIKEVPGSFDKDDSDYDMKKKEILKNFRSLGEINNYTQRITANYAIPINKIGLLNWTTASYTYTGNYVWQRAPAVSSSIGNTIENSNSQQLNLNGNMVNFYNKIPYLKNLNSNVNKKNTSSKNKVDIKNESENKLETKKDSLDKARPNYLKIALDKSLKLMMSLKNVSFNLTEGKGTLLPGFMYEPKGMGNNWDKSAPGIPFTMGWQPDIDTNWVNKIGNDQNRWLTRESSLNTALTQKKTQNIMGRATIEPIKNLKIDVSFNKNYTENYASYYRYVGGDSAYKKGEPLYKINMPTQSGSYSISFMMFKTAWFKDDDKNYSNTAFDDFKENTMTIAKRLADEKNPDWLNKKGEVYDSITKKYYPYGFGPTSSQVLIPAFIAAYTGRDAKKVKLDPFKMIPMPNWTIKYDGLIQYSLIKEYFKSFILTSAYKSSFTIGNFITNVNYSEDRIDKAGNYIAKNDITQISAMESFSPLIGVNMSWKNNILSNFEYRKSRSLNMSFVNIQLTEVKSNEYIFGIGYTFKDINFKVLQNLKAKNVKSDLVIKSDVSIRQNKTILRQMVENVDRISAGTDIISINTSVEYQISSSLSAKLFYDRTVNKPQVSNQFKTSNTSAGFSVRFMLAQ